MLHLAEFHSAAFGEKIKVVQNYRTFTREISVKHLSIGFGANFTSKPQLICNNNYHSKGVYPSFI